MVQLLYHNLLEDASFRNSPAQKKLAVNIGTEG
jgi:hypothetical protein